MAIVQSGGGGTDLGADIGTGEIADANVTYAKIQNVSATQRLLGRNTSGAGVVEEVTPAQARTMLCSGAQVKKAADQTTADYTTSTAISWDSEVYDDNGFHEGVTNPSRFTVPTGVTRINLNANVVLTSVTANLTASLFLRKNGATDFDGAAAVTDFNNSTTRRLSLTALGVSCVATDYFEVFLQMETDTSITVESERTNFTIQVVKDS